jgi:hypothetical protein
MFLAQQRPLISLPNRKIFVFLTMAYTRSYYRGISIPKPTHTRLNFIHETDLAFGTLNRIPLMVHAVTGIPLNFSLEGVVGQKDLLSWKEGAEPWTQATVDLNYQPPWDENITLSQTLTSKLQFLRTSVWY